MAKTSFAKPGAAKAPTPGAAKPAPSTGAQAPAKPTPAKPAAPGKPAAPAAKPAPPAANVPLKKPSALGGPIKPPPGIRTNVQAGEPQRPAPRKPEPEPELPLEEQEEEPLEETGAEERAIVVREPTGPPGDNLMTSAVGQPVGEYDANDYELPSLKIVQGTSDELLELGFSVGDIILNKEAILWQAECAPVEFTVARYHKQFMQQLDFGSDEMPKIYGSAAEAQADGLVAFGGHEVGFVAFATALIVIKQPEGVECGVFSEEFDGVLYGLALWRLTGMGYKHAGRKIMTDYRVRLQSGLHHGSFQLEGRKEKGKINSYWVPQVRSGEDHSPEFIAFIESIAGGA